MFKITIESNDVDKDYLKGYVYVFYLDNYNGEELH